MSLNFRPQLILLLLLLVVGSFSIDGVNCLRKVLYPKDEPISLQVHNNYRILNTDLRFYHLKFAGLLNDSQIDGQYFLEDHRNPDGSFAKGTFYFNSTDYLRKGLTVQWFAPWVEHAALPTYDDPHERDLATGPQVDQDLCGLHLDYMIHLNKKYNQRIDNSTELSIFHIMMTYDVPKLGISIGNSYAPGDYMSCKRATLNVMRNELAEVNETAAERYFQSLVEKQAEKPGLISQSLKIIRQYLGPFVGYLKETDRLNMDDYKDKLNLLPMRYCFNKLRWPSWPNSSHYIRNDVFKTGICLPETCDSNSLKIHYDKIYQLTRSQMTDYYDGFYISDLFCMPDEQSELRNPFNYPSTIMFLIFNGIWFSLSILATWINSRSSKRKQTKDSTNNNRSKKTSKWREFLMCWSLKKNIRDFVAALPADNSNNNSTINSGNGSGSNENSKKEIRVDTSSLEGFKVISSIAVIASHACIIGFTIAWNPRSGHDIISRGWMAMTNTICPAVVDNFFTVTGVIMAKVLFAMRPKVLTKPAFWIKFMVYRYIRIVPLYLFLHWFLQSTFRFLGDGPFWDYGTSHTAWTKMCQEESYWTVILPSANFKSPGIHCNGVGWYLANDLQFMLVTPFIILLLLKKPLIGHLTILSALAVLITNHILYFLRVDQDLVSLFEVNLLGITRVLDDTTEGYVFPQYRFPAFLVGLAAGHVLHLYDIGVIKKWPKAFLTYGKVYMYFIFYLICFIPYIGSLVPTNDLQLVKILAAIKDGTLHTVISSAVAIFILFLCTNQLRYISTPYSWYIFKPLANSSLCTLLVHIPLLFYHNQTLTYLPELSTYYMLSSIIAWAIQSFAISVVVHVLYELPMRRFFIKALTTLFADNKGKTEQDKKEKKQ